MTHNDCAPVASSSLVSVGSAVYRIELSSVMSSRPAPTVANSAHRRRPVI